MAPTSLHAVNGPIRFLLMMAYWAHAMWVDSLLQEGLMAFSSFPDVFSWIQNLPPLSQWKSSSMISLDVCSSSPAQPSLKLSIKNLNQSSFSLSIFADYNLPFILWTSKTIQSKSTSNKLLNDTDSTSTLLFNFIQDVLKYSANRCPYHLKLPHTYPDQHSLKDIFNFSFLSLIFIISIYEAPKDLRSSCLKALKSQLACPKSRGVSTALMRMLGSNVEEQWMRSINLAITNWIVESQGANQLGSIKTPSPLFSYSFSAYGMWKVQLYCPVIAMNVEKASGPAHDDRLVFSLNYHQLEGVIQLNYKVAVREKWIEIAVNTDNIRCDIIKLLTDTQLNERGAGTLEKHFPSRIALQITPTTLQSNILSISLSKSSENPTTSITVEKGLEASFEPPTSIGINFSAAESATTVIRPWKFEQSVFGNSANLNWFLHDSEDGREVFSSKPSKFALINQKAWFKNRYSNADRPFTRGGGVIFAGDEYGERVCWKVERGCAGKNMEWEIRGWIWATYWPNKYRSFYSETRRLEFREVVSLNLV